MSAGSIALAFFIVVGLVFLGLSLFRRARRARLLREPLSRRWQQLLADHVPLYLRLPGSERRAVQAMVKVFLHEKNFEACGDLPEVTPQMRATIAGNACVMLAGRPVDEPFPRLRSVLVYPAAFQLPRPRLDPNADPLFPETTTEAGARLGESWETGSIVLSWEDVAHSSYDPGDGFNLVIHEFSHQLDATSGETDGVPLLDRGGDYRSWHEVFLAAYERHSERLKGGLETTLDEYAATAPEEFFAVASEAFFEIPKALHQNYPRLYAELKRYYRLDPAR